MKLTTSHPRPRNRSGSGVALVVTLILLAVITTLAVAFVALTHRETAAVGAVSSTIDAENATELAFERAKAEILARFISANERGITSRVDVAGPGLMVSLALDARTNRFDPVPPYDSPRETPVGAYLDPSPPVFVQTNLQDARAPLDERFFLDLNRNGFFDETGHLPVTLDGPLTAPLPLYVDPNSGDYVTNWVVGDPMWIGVPTRSRAYLITQIPGHTNDNPYLSRYAWIVTPVGHSLDINSIHNQAINLNLAGGQNGYYRNQGVGPWENNLAAFLADLNTNYWPALPGGNNPLNGALYDFQPFNYDGTLMEVALGAAFNDAREILTYRYSPGNYPTLLDTAPDLFPATALANLNTDSLDYYSRLRLDLRPGDVRDTDATGGPWPGARSRRNYQNLIHDLWDPAKLPLDNGFRRQLRAASTSGNTYDRYTYYRLLSQLGTDTSNEDYRINVNYVNVQSWAVNNRSYRKPVSEMVSWNSPEAKSANFVAQMGRTGPELFFLSAVRQIFLQDTNYHTFVTNNTSLPDRPVRIPVYLVQTINGVRYTNYPYSGRIHQVLQQVANIFDATRDVENYDRPAQHAGYFPTIYRPMFEVDPDGSIYVVDFKLVENANEATALQWMRGLAWRDAALGERPGGTDDMFYQAPVIVGARKGFPSLNEFSTRTSVQATRRLDARKAVGETRIENFNFTERFDLAITNEFGVEAWNSYVTSSYPRNVNLYFTNRVIAEIHRDGLLIATLTNGASIGGATLPMTKPANTWLGAAYDLTKGYVHSNFPGRTLLHWTNIAPITASGPEHKWTVSVRNQLRFYLVDTEADRIIDAVSMSATNEFFDVGERLSRRIPNGGVVADIWSQNSSAGKPWRYGIEVQLNVSRGSPNAPDTIWRDYSPNTASNKTDGVRAFQAFILDLTNTTARVPFTPSRLLVQKNFWRANDPLVHYTAEDLWRGTEFIDDKPLLPAALTLQLGTKNQEYRTWDNDQADRNPAIRDPGMRRSDNWQFPTNKVPTVGFLGRVHRGSPWQTIYLKSAIADIDSWRKHNNPNRRLDTSYAMHPMNDWRLVDVFTAAGHRNATRGRLAVNQTNVAAWSAVLSGLAVSTTTNVVFQGVPITQTTNHVIDPAALSDPGLPESLAIERIVNSIIYHQTNFGSFRRLSEFLRVPELTLGSPLLSNANVRPFALPREARLTDTDFEAIPEKILELVKPSEQRFVIYSWGQSLKPAEFGVQRQGNAYVRSGPSVETSGDNQGMPKNYQITGEHATRAVVRIDFERLSRDPNNPLYREFNYARPIAVVESFNIIPPD